MTTSMRGDAGKKRTRRSAAYLLLLGIQTGAAGVLFLAAFPLFQQIVMRSGEPQQLEASTTITVLSAALVMQACYWGRYRYLPIPALLRSAVVGHLLMFMSRVSFFFGGALFAAIFFRHVPQLDSLPPFSQGVAKLLGVMTLLFALFCYSLELERLGRASEESAGNRPGERPARGA